ncbi:unnamed protein product [Cuscuta campestris]|uniref:MULE transposase domain-containing protein n=1 Tax=Cuscuta campestris TaxID=132261 RepID=A0A484M482_9ASTE|nr:unnamed protein product [Cuscuta campestris]
MEDSVLVRGRAIGAAVLSFLDQLDRLLEGEFVWMSYPNLDTLPRFCSAGLRIWISRIPLIYGYVVEMYYPDQFYRQFGALQRVPLDVVYDPHLHNIKSNTMELADNERHYLDVWEGRYAANVLMEFGMPDATHEYRHCYLVWQTISALIQVGTRMVLYLLTRHQSGVYVGSRPLLINDKPTWRHFIRKASREYDAIKVFIMVSKNVEEEVDEEEDVNPFFQQPMGHPSSSHYAQHVDSDPDDAEYVSPLTEDEESSEEDEDISSDEGDDGDNARAMPHLEDIQRRETHRSLQPTFHVQIIEVGNTYPSFQSLQEAVSLRNIAEHRHFRTVAKWSRYWRASCVCTPQCTWFIQAAENAGTTMWTIKKYQWYHQCRPDHTRAKDDKLLTSELISTLIDPKIQEDANYKIKLIIRDVYELFQVSVSYKKAWYVFWSFKASMDGFHYCLPVIPVDRTHLYDKYKGCLLLAIATTGNGEIFPLAFSIVDAEDGASWKWFMTNVMRHVVPPHRRVCIISDRHGGIDHAFENVPELGGGQVTRTYCLRHLRSNFWKKFQSKKLWTLMYRADEALNRSEFDLLILRIASKNQEAYNWLNAIPKHKWALSHDEGGARYGIMTTNSSESFNNVLEGSRCLPVYAIVKFTYDKLVKLFAERRTNGYVWQQSGCNFPMNV